MIPSLLVFIIAFGCYSRNEALPIGSGNRNVFTNLTYSSAEAVRSELSSAVSQGELRGIKLGSAGSKARNDIGAATSYGIGQLEFMRILMGVSAAKAKSSEAISKMIHSNLGGRWHMSRSHRFKRDDASAATSLNSVTGPGAKAVMGSTGISAGPVATSLSLGSILLAANKFFSSVNAGSLAAHAGTTDSTSSFSNSDIWGDHDEKKKDKKKKSSDEAEDEGHEEVEDIDVKAEDEENSGEEGSIDVRAGELEKDQDNGINVKPEKQEKAEEEEANEVKSTEKEEKAGEEEGNEVKSAEKGEKAEEEEGNEVKSAEKEEMAEEEEEINDDDDNKDL